MIKPLGKSVLLEPQEKKSATESGIVLTVAVEEATIGTVIAIGSEVLDVREGDKVIYKQYAPEEIEIDGKKLLLCEEESIMAIINEE